MIHCSRLQEENCNAPSKLQGHEIPCTFQVATENLVFKILKKSLGQFFHLSSCLRHEPTCAYIERGILSWSSVHSMIALFSNEIVVGTSRYNTQCWCNNVFEPPGIAFDRYN